MDSNELVMEIKPVNAVTAGIKKDLRTLTAYRRHANYRRAILLVYGGLQEDFEPFRLNVRSITERDAEESIDLSLIELWQHDICGQAAARVRW
jgi:hypothetical protein